MIPRFGNGNTPLPHPEEMHCMGKGGWHTRRRDLGFPVGWEWSQDAEAGSSSSSQTSQMHGSELKGLCQSPGHQSTSTLRNPGWFSNPCPPFSLLPTSSSSVPSSPLILSVSSHCSEFCLFSRGLAWLGRVQARGAGLA